VTALDALEAALREQGYRARQVAAAPPRRLSRADEAEERDARGGPRNQRSPRALLK